MRRTLTSLLLTAAFCGAVSGCGADDGSGEAVDPPTSASSSPSTSSGPSSPSTSSSEASSDAPEHQLVEMVTETAVGGEVGTSAVLSDPEALATFLAQFKGTGMVARLQELIDGTDVPEGLVAYAAVVAIGCDAPRDVTLSEGPGGLVVEAQPVAAPKVECLAAMTTVAVLLVPSSAV